MIAVIFDMDGVIADTNPHHLVAWHQFLAKYGIHATDQEMHEHMFGKHNSYILEYFFKRKMSGDELHKLQFEKEAMFREIYTPIAEPIAGLLTFIEDLKRQGVKTGIATSAPVENLEAVLSKIPLRASMESLLSEQDVTRHKPFPDVYLKSAVNLGIAPERCVVFEDSRSGVQAGLNAGMKVVGVTTTYSPEELPPCQAYIPDYQNIDYSFIEALIKI
ncbi:MAG: HAD family phosphatase [Spirosomaceae bacterium]|jgi:beta-phosphoglucomutase family hydrolase|nr:HAD family phosphatase [Spirosomataceae bacterium]